MMILAIIGAVAVGYFIILPMIAVAVEVVSLGPEYDDDEHDKNAEP